MHPDAEANYQLLRREPNAVLVHTHRPHAEAEPVRLVRTRGPLRHATQRMDHDADGARIQALPIAPIKILICRPEEPPYHAFATTCHPEPVPLGVQIQPSGKNWVGTAGCFARRGDPSDPLSFGCLTNWHVMPWDPAHDQLPAHQPTAQYSPIAWAVAANQPRPGKPNTCDAAFCHCWDNPFHTCSPDVHNIGPVAGTPRNLAVGDHVTKQGRTTHRTHGHVTAAGVAARVQYDGFVAEFIDQLEIVGDSAPFSAPGDSGSAVFSEPDLSLGALLFAGGGGITIASPIHHVTEALSLTFPTLP